MMKQRTMRLTLSAMFVAIGLILPFFTGQIPQIGRMLLPMHIPVFLCGLICGWRYGLIVGFILPLLRGMLFQMPVLFPNGTAMAFELSVYGFMSGLLYHLPGKRSVFSLYRAIIVAMITGRVVWGIAEIILLGISGSRFTWQLFVAGAFLNAIPGIIIQLVLLPAVMLGLERAGVLRDLTPSDHGVLNQE